MDGDRVIAKILKAEGVEWVSCFPHQPLIDAVTHEGIRPILTRQERAGVNMADTLDVMSDWSYGLPYATVLSNGEVLIVYYAGLTERMDVKWVRLSC